MSGIESKKAKNIKSLGILQICNCNLQLNLNLHKALCYLGQFCGHLWAFMCPLKVTISGTKAGFLVSQKSNKINTFDRPESPSSDDFYCVYKNASSNK